MEINPAEATLRQESGPVEAGPFKYRMDLLVFCNQLNMIGVRHLSSFLKSKGVEVRIVYLISPVDYFTNIFSEGLYRQISEFCRGSDIIGLSLTSNFFPEASRLTLFLKERLGIPVVWGGVHPTIEVEESLKYADYVVMGEGEMPVFELITSLAGNKDISHIENLAFKNNGLIVKNPLRGLNRLDELPMPDIDFTAHYLSDGDEIKPITFELMRRHMVTLSNKPRVTYSVSSTRGCPHSCTYCVNYAFREIFGHKGYVRERSIEKIIEELVVLIKRFPFIEYIFMADETFFFQGADKIKRFAQMYKEEISLPLKIEFSPGTFDEEKLKYMLDAGAVELHMGVESGSDDTNYNIYNRKFPINRIKLILNSIEKYRHLLEVVHIHFLMCNPFEKPSGTKETFRFIVDIPNSFRIRFFPLVLFPGTKLLEMAVSSGIVKDREEDIYSKTWNIGDSLNSADYYTICSIYLYELKHHLKIGKTAGLLFYSFMSFLPVRAILGSRPGRRGLARLYLLMQKVWRAVRKKLKR